MSIDGQQNWNNQTLIASSYVYKVSIIYHNKRIFYWKFVNVALMVLNKKRSLIFAKIAARMRC